MSEFVRLLNQIKVHKTQTWLTPSQLEATKALQKALRIPGSVNLFGSVGVGKTFLGWNLADETGYTYLSHVEHFAQFKDTGVTGVIIDNCTSSRATHRDICKQLGFQNIRHAVLITQQMIDDYTPYVELRLVDLDWDKVIENLGSIGVFGDTRSASNLWQLLNPHLLQGA